jgi:hypothetical protein
MEKLRVGDRVEVFDGSSSCGIRNGEFVYTIDNRNGDRFNLRVCSIGLYIKTRLSYNAADTLVTDDEGNYWFVRSDLCHIMKRTSEMQSLKVGDRVNVMDNSYSFGIRDGKYEGLISRENGDCYNLKVVTVGLKVGRKGVDVAEILVTDGKGNYWFVKERMCQIVPKHTIFIDDQPVELSDESYARMKLQFKVPEHTITIDNEVLKLSEASYQNLKAQFNE